MAPLAKHILTVDDYPNAPNTRALCAKAIGYRVSKVADGAVSGFQVACALRSDPLTEDVMEHA